MTCVFPIDAWRAREVNESGKRGIVFNPREANLDEPLQVPCGKCLGCCADKARIWSVRMYHESTLHERNCFVTLTYADPPPVLDKRHLQLFFKRLRKETKFRYFACGEYGSTTHRPHYHAILFGVDFLGGSYRINDQLYGHPVLQDAWRFGLTSIAEVNLATCMYVAGYVNKKIGDKDTFNMMSLRPAIGKEWIAKYRDDVRRTGFVVIEGQRFPVPPKYLEWHSDELASVIDDRSNFMRNRSIDEIFRAREVQRSRDLNYRSRLGLRSEFL